MPEINYLAVLVAAVVSMIIGSIWHGPLFGKKYLELSGINQMSPEQREAMKKGMTKMYVLQFISSLLMFYVLAVLAGLLGTDTVPEGLNVGFWTWLGFAVPLKMSEAIWGGKWPLFWIGIGNMLITLLAAGAIIGAWR